MIVKNKLCNFENWAVVRRSKPVVWSTTAPVARWYLCRASSHIIQLLVQFIHDVFERNAPVAIRVSVVPVSTIPAVSERMFVDEPYRIDWSMPKNSDAGNVSVIGLRCTHNV